MKKILITGASDGIGFEIAKCLAQDGDQLQLVARRKEKLEKALGAIGGTGHSFLVADLSRKEDVHMIAEHMAQTHYDVLINCAGIGMYGRFEEMTLGDQVSMINLNILGLTALSYHYLKTAKKGDSLVNIASTLGTSSFPGAAVYAATKAYVTNLSENLWWENKNRGVFVLGFCPGATLTSFHETSGGSKEMFPKFIAQTPQQVAAELVRALNRRSRPKAVSGGVNRLMLGSQRLMSRKTVVNMMGGFSPLNAKKSRLD